ncbi:hypothetical protein K1T71_002828 [Dendrolimus kikuchii]|uniref:Uncharacterized protein n=1 Tax=Dendrolimus kikuchii TaxID=765133 RepID=A0ACC1DE55_9NEOP|nr:hypothetical protein K1T71_002828 [Dendrolimus kikuchii]
MAERIAVKFVILTLLVASPLGSTGFTSFSYGVSDPNTGDFKDQQERREGSNVVGKYSLIDADGTKRIVEYSASDETGFKAVVLKERAGVGPGVPGSFGHGGLVHGGVVSRHFEHPGGAEGAGHVHHPTPVAGSPLLHVNHPGILVGPLPHGIHNRLPYANPPESRALSQEGVGYGYGAPLAGGLTGNPVGTLPRRPLPAISHYSHTIVHDVRPYRGPYAGAPGGYNAYDRYGAQAPSAHDDAHSQGVLAQGVLNPSQTHGPFVPPSPQQGLISYPAHGHFGLPAHNRLTVPQSHGVLFSPQTQPGPPLANRVFTSFITHPGQVPLANGPIGPSPPYIGLPSSVSYGGLTYPLAHGVLLSPLAPGGLPPPLAHGGLPNTLPQGGLDNALNQNQPLGQGDPRHAGPRSPFFNGPLAQGGLPHSALAESPVSQRTETQERSEPSLERQQPHEFQ